MNGKSIQRAQAPSDEFLELAEQYHEVVILTHDNPDPDGIASGWALSHLLEKTLRKSSRVIAGGEILRAENRRLVELLHPPLRLERTIRLPEGGLVVLVDTSLEATNHVGIDTERHDVAIIDHHASTSTVDDGVAVFRDVRRGVAATASLTASYLREHGILPSEPLATALLYAIQTETRGGQFHVAPLDRAMLGWISERADPSLLAEIVDAPVPRSYFSDLALALQSTTLHGDSALCILPQAHSAEIIGEVADLLLRHEQMAGVLCAAVYRGDLLMSVRTAYRSTKSAVRLARRVLGGRGGSGGHAHRAGGVIRDFAALPNTESLLADLKTRWNASWSAADQTPRRLVAREDVMRCV